MVRTEADPTSIPTGWKTRQPGTAIWTFYSSLYALGFLLFALVENLIPRFRPSPHWSYKQAFLGSLIKHVSVRITEVGLLDSIDLKPGKLGNRFIVMDPAPEEVYLDAFSSDTVKPKQIGATWYPSTPSKQQLEGSQIVLWFHSGSFIYLSGRPHDSEPPALALNSRLGPNTFSLWVQYRLAGCKNDPAPYPGPMQDGLTSYLYLTRELGINPSRILIGGDSSGSTIAIALVRYLENYGADKTMQTLPFLLPKPPRACILLSPSLDYCTEADGEELAAHKNSKTDYLVPRMMAWGSCAFAPPPIALDSPFISPARHPFFTSTAIYVQSGGGELLCDSIRVFVKKMQDVKGNKVEYFEMPHAPHDIFAIGAYAGWKEGGELICDEVANFVKHLQPEEEEVEEHTPQEQGQHSRLLELSSQSSPDSTTSPAHTLSHTQS